MAIAPRTLSNDEPFPDLEDDLVYILLAFLACPLTETLAPPFVQLLTDMEPLRAKQTQYERAVAAEEAKIPFADDGINVLLDETRKEVSVQLDAEQAAKILGRLFEKRSAGVLRRFTLGEQLDTQRGWPDILAPLQNAKLTALAQRITHAVKYADDVLSNQAKAQTELDTFLLGPRADYVARCNKARGAVFGKVLEIAKDPVNAPLPSDFVDRFFLRDTSGRVKRLSDLEKMIERLRAKLGKLEARHTEMKDKIENTAREKLETELAERKAKLAETQKAAEDEVARVAALEAELGKKKKP